MLRIYAETGRNIFISLVFLLKGRSKTTNQVSTTNLNIYSNKTSLQYLILIVPKAWEISYTQPCINCWGKSAIHFVYF